MSDIAIFSNPLLIILFSLAVVIFVAGLFIKQKIVNVALKIVFAVITTCLVIFLLLYGASYQEVLIVVLAFLVANLFFLYGFIDKKKGEDKE